MASEQSASSEAGPHSIPSMEQLEQGRMPPTEHVQPTTEAILNTANSLLANITASSLLPASADSAKLPDLPLLPPLSMSSLLLAASADIISSITSGGGNEQLDNGTLNEPQPSIQPASSDSNVTVSMVSPTHTQQSLPTPAEPTMESVVQPEPANDAPVTNPDIKSVSTATPSVSASLLPSVHTLFTSLTSNTATQPNTQPLVTTSQPLETTSQPLVNVSSASTQTSTQPNTQPSAVTASGAVSQPSVQPSTPVTSQPLPKPVQAVLLSSNAPMTVNTSLGASAQLVTRPVSNAPQLIKPTSLSQVASRPKSNVVPALIGQVTAEILTKFQPPPLKQALTVKSPLHVRADVLSKPVDSKPSGPTRVSAGEILASVTGLNEPPRGVRVGTPSLQANEQLISDDESSDEEMDTQQPVQVEPSVSATSVPEGRTSSRSDSPYADDDSFASFLAREVHESALDDLSSSSRSPTPAQVTDVHTLVSHLQGQTSGGPGLRRFGVTASCPPAPVQLPEGTVNASLDMTSRNFPKRSKYAHRAAMSAMYPYNRTRGGGASVAKTLDLFKAVLQSSFNMEVKRLCDDYLNIFTQAATNIRENTGDSVPDATLRLLVCKMIEEAQQGYVAGKWDFPYGKLPRSEKVMSPNGSPMATKKLKMDKVESRFGPPKRVRKPPADRSSEKSAVWKWGMDKRRLDPEKWEPEKMTPETVFCLGVNVNKALGHAANRGKVYYLHPELFKYACDGDDKTWLYENKYLPVHGGKAFLMIYSEVTSLVASDELYKDTPEVVSAVAKLQQFRVPQFMIDKMKTFMKSVQGYFAQEAHSNGPSTNKQ